MMAAYVSYCDRSFAPSTGGNATSVIGMFLAWVKQSIRNPGPDVLSRVNLAAFHDHLVGRGLERSTVNTYVRIVERFWAWAWDDEDIGDSVPRLRRLRLREPAQTPTRAPTWQQMDDVIEQCSGWVRRAAVLLRFTGLRKGAVMALRWSDVDFSLRQLVFRGELGKSRQERAGRVIPISRHLVAELAAWGRRDGFLVHAARNLGSRVLLPAWEAAGVPEAVWRRRTAHAFRKGFITELRRTGADVDAIEYLVGHSLGLRGIYTDPAGLPLADAVDLIPPLGGAVVASLDRRRRGEG